MNGAASVQRPGPFCNKWIAKIQVSRTVPTFRPSPGQVQWPDRGVGTNEG